MLKYIITIIIFFISIILLFRCIKYNQPIIFKKFHISNGNGKFLCIKKGKLVFGDDGDILFIGVNKNLVLQHNNLVYELGMNSNGKLVSYRIPNVSFTICNNNIKCNDNLYLNSNLVFRQLNDNSIYIYYISE